MPSSILAYGKLQTRDMILGLLLGVNHKRRSFLDYMDQSALLHVLREQEMNFEIKEQSFFIFNLHNVYVCGFHLHLLV